MARVLVTGATGFIGRHLVGRLLERGDCVRCLIHEREERVADAECVHGDVTVPETLVKAVRNIDIVYHLAGATVVWSPHWYETINALGTRHVAEACADLPSPPVLVFLSSLAAAGPTTPDNPRREEDLAAPVSEYGRSKLLGERCLRRLARRLPCTVLRPPGVFGPGDTNVLPLFKSARWGVNFIPGNGEQRLSFIHVAELVRALPEAAERGERLSDERGADSQGVYFVALDEHVSLEELGQRAVDAVHDGMGKKRVRSIVMPAPALKALARANDFYARLTKTPLLLSTDKIREAFAGSWICTSAKARRAWGFACRTGLCDGFQKTVQWYRERAWL